MDEFDWGSLLDAFGGDSIPSIDYSNLLDAFGGIDLSNVDLTGGNLSNIDLSNIDLGGFNLSDYASLADAFGGTSNIDLSNVDLGGGFSTADYSALADAFGGSTDTSGITQLLGSSDLSNVVSPATDTVTIQDLQDAGINLPTTTDQSQWTDVGGLNVLNEDVSGLTDTGIIDQLDSGVLGESTIPGIEGFGSASDAVGGATQQDTSEAQYSTTRQNADGTVTQTFDDGSTITIAKDPVTGQETVVDYTTATDIPPPGGEIVPSGTGRGGPTPSIPGGTTGTGGIKGSDIKTAGGTKTGSDNTGKSILDAINKLTGGTGNTALLTALLGGILGLLNKKPTATGPVGYKGGIPTYTATRGTPTSPTAGGRRPGGAGIGSLTGGVSYTKAAHGGLMGLAEGGRPARYLRGGTDGMADKIKTSIGGDQPARLSHGEFVIPADVVSHLGNGNSDAGADVLYDMMAKVRKARTGNPRQGRQINPNKFTPA